MGSAAGHVFTGVGSRSCGTVEPRMQGASTLFYIIGIIPFPAFQNNFMPKVYHEAKEVLPSQLY